MAAPTEATLRNTNPSILASYERKYVLVSPYLSPLVFIDKNFERILLGLILPYLLNISLRFTSSLGGILDSIYLINITFIKTDNIQVKNHYYNLI